MEPCRHFTAHAILFPRSMVLRGRRPHVDHGSASIRPRRLALPRSAAHGCRRTRYGARSPPMARQVELISLMAGRPQVRQLTVHAASALSLRQRRRDLSVHSRSPDESCADGRMPTISLLSAGAQRNRQAPSSFMRIVERRRHHHEFRAERQHTSVMSMSGAQTQAPRLVSASNGSRMPLPRYVTVAELKHSIISPARGRRIVFVSYSRSVGAASAQGLGECGRASAERHCIVGYRPPQNSDDQSISIP